MSAEEDSGSSTSLLHQDSMKAVALTVFDEDTSEAKEVAGSATNSDSNSESNSESNLDSDSKTDVESLPQGWEKHESKSNPGLFYYFNSETGETIWKPPQAQSEENKQSSTILTKSGEEKEMPSNIHLEDIPIAPPAGAKGIVPPPKQKSNSIQESEPILLKKTHFASRPRRSHGP